jgi:hypothetical protein
MFFDNFNGPSEQQAVEHIMYILNSNKNNAHLLKNVSDDSIQMITKKELNKMGGVQNLGSRWLWLEYTSKDLLERVKQELSIMNDFS